ncbi:MAG: hypothetical protein M0R06_02200 [Sphaerochaeta sp.]|jgi:hypothetical protein|nr:hypothetical protein [Sphaerochaeta sp.]
MDVLPAQIAEWTGWTFAGATGIAVIFAFLRGWIVPRSVVDDYKEREANHEVERQENKEAFDALLEIGHTTVSLLRSIKDTEQEAR